MRYPDEMLFDFEQSTNSGIISSSVVKSKLSGSFTIDDSSGMIVLIF